MSPHLDFAIIFETVLMVQILSIPIA